MCTFSFPFWNVFYCTDKFTQTNYLILCFGRNYVIISKNPQFSHLQHVHQLYIQFLGRLKKPYLDGHHFVYLDADIDFFSSSQLSTWVRIFVCTYNHNPPQNIFTFKARSIKNNCCN